MRLRHRVELDTAVFGTWYLKQRHRLLVEDEAIGIVVDDDDVVILCKLHQSLVGLTTRIATRRHVGIVGPHQLHVREIHLLQFVEVGLPPIVLTQVVIHNLRTQYLRERCIGGIARIGHEHLVARIHESEGDVEDTLLRTDERLYLRLGVEIDIIPTLVEVGHRLAELWRSHRGLISVGTGVVGHFTELLDGLWRWRHIGTADGEADDILTFSIQLGYLLQLTAEVVFTY